MSTHAQFENACTARARARAREVRTTKSFAHALARGAMKSLTRAMAVTALALAPHLAHPSPVRAAVAPVVATSAAIVAPAVSTAASPASAQLQSSGSGGSSLEAAASKASSVGRKVAMSLIALGFAMAAVVLTFRRDFKEAAGVVAVGLVAILLATPIGVDVLHNTVTTLFG